jgi:hypothetical protein
MIAAEAGCRHPDRVHAYLNNLYRLGLIWFSREPVRDRMRYHVLEAQPEVVAAMRKGRRTAVRRSVLLTRSAGTSARPACRWRRRRRATCSPRTGLPPAPAEPVVEPQTQ